MIPKCPGKTNGPKRFNPRSLSVHKKALFDVATQEMNGAGPVRKSRSPWVFSIEKADGAKKRRNSSLVCDVTRYDEK